MSNPDLAVRDAPPPKVLEAESARIDEQDRRGAETPRWTNLRAADAARASSADVLRLAPAGRGRVLKSYLRNPTAVLGTMILVAINIALMALGQPE